MSQVIGSLISFVTHQKLCCNNQAKIYYLLSSFKRQSFSGVCQALEVYIMVLKPPSNLYLRFHNYDKISATNTKEIESYHMVYPKIHISNTHSSYLFDHNTDKPDGLNCALHIINLKQFRTLQFCPKGLLSQIQFENGNITQKMMQNCMLPECSTHFN